MELTFLRHGQTDLNGKGYFGTDLDYPLNEIWVSQCLLNVFPEESFDSVYSSPFKRTIQTSNLVYPYMKPITSSLITQRDLGDLKEKLKREYDLEYIKQVRDYIITPKNAETIEDMIRRLNSFFEYLVSIQNPSYNILVVTHNGIMRVIKRFYINESEIETPNVGSFKMKI